MAQVNTPGPSAARRGESGATRPELLAWFSTVCHILPVVDQVMARRLAEHCADAQRVAQVLQADLDALRAERAGAQRVVASLDRQIAAIEQFTGMATNLTSLENGEPDMQEPSSGSDGATVPQQRPLAAEASATATGQTPTTRAATRRSATYRDLVLPLLAQDRQRWWKAREIAEAVGVGKVASLREALRGMAGRGLLEYESDDLYGARYRAVPPASEGAVVA